jgi:hypothetical protein
MKLYKLTDENGYTRNKTHWGEGVSHSGTGKGKLCGPGYIHAYTHPLLAVFLNPIHANLDNPLLWEAEGEIALEDHGLKVGCIKLTTTHQIPLPTITIEHRVRFAIGCALFVCHDAGFVQWANAWLDGIDRSANASALAAEAAESAAWAAAWAAWAAAKAANASAKAAWAAFPFGNALPIMRIAEWAVGTKSWKELEARG